jgi:predicted RNA-binding Zn ribbon-like protein
MGQSNFDSYGEEVPFGSLAAELVNSLDAAQPQADELATSQGLRRLLERNGLPLREVAEADLKAARALRTQLRRLFETRDAQEAIAAANALLLEAHLQPQLRRHGESVSLGWRLTAKARPGEQLLGAVALNIAVLISRYGLERLRVCDDTPCRDVFVDVSKNGARRYCGSACANRARVASFRERQRGAKAPRV